MRKSASNGRNKSLMQTYVSSMISLVLCCAMLLGTTMAWFTATVESNGHEIYIGTLDIDLLNEGVSLKDFEETPLFNDVPRWEPNATAIEQLTVKNLGDLAFKYKLTFRSTESAIVNTAATNQFEVWVHPGAWTVTGNDYEDFTAANGWTKVGSLTEVLAGKTVFSGSMDKDTVVDPSTGDKVEHEDIYTVALHMVKEATGEGIMGKTVQIDVKLEATQLTSESDTFGDDYDENAGGSLVPTAFVIELDDPSIRYTTSFPNMNPIVGTPGALDTAYEFKTIESYADAQTSPYRWYHADFVVSADKDVPADSIMLAGYYSAFCDGWNDGKWVGMVNSGMNVTAGTEIRLVESLGYGSGLVNYKTLCQYVEAGDSFQCGAMALDPAALAGTTLTVELRLYEPENANSDSGSHLGETGEYITIGTFKYTFGENPVVVSDSTELKTALKNAAAGDTIYLNAGTYDGLTFAAFSDGVFGDVTIAGTPGAELNGLWLWDDVNSTASFDNITFKDITFTSKALICVSASNITFENCVFTEDACIHFDNNAYSLDNITVKNCDFFGDATVGNTTTTAIMLEDYNNLTVTGCTFTDIDYNAMQICHGSGKLVITDNEFIKTNNRVVKIVGTDTNLSRVDISNNAFCDPTATSGKADGNYIDADVAVTIGANTYATDPASNFDLYFTNVTVA